MKNFIFISPHFPIHYFKFVIALKKEGFNVLGVGDCPYDNLCNELKENLKEYYYCPNMDQDFNSLISSIKFFVDKYGHIDYLESNNEYWLSRDAKLRDIFNIEGVKPNEIEFYQHKSLMKECFNKAGCNVAPWIIFENEEQLKKFISEVDYPIFIKPNYGVGAEGGYKLENSLDLLSFLNNRNPNVEYICEKFISGIIVSYDGISDGDCNVVFSTNNIFPPSILDIVKQGKDLFYYCYPSVMNNIDIIGRKVIKSFNVKKRFFHIEFFIVTTSIKGYFDAGDIVALETNMRPAGGFTTDMINFANSIDCYKIFAQILMNNSTDENFAREKYYCGCASRRDFKEYLYSETEIMNKYDILMNGRYPEIVSNDMGNTYFIAKFKSLEEVNDFHMFVNQLKHAPINNLRNKNSYLTGEDIDMFNEEKSNKKQDTLNICDKSIDGA